MKRKPKYPQLANIVFLSVGETLRDATAYIPKENLPEDILRLLRRLKRVELRDARKNLSPGDDTA